MRYCSVSTRNVTAPPDLELSWSPASIDSLALLSDLEGGSTKGSVPRILIRGNSRVEVGFGSDLGPAGCGSIDGCDASLETKKVKIPSLTDVVNLSYT